jgi:hypothetical protein
MWSHEQIELEARKLLRDIEKSANRLWPNTPPARVYMCDPEAACRLLDLAYVPDSHLGTFGGTATAGMLDRVNRAVLLSSKQKYEAMRFTAAHEIGHWLLHTEENLFRDRSLSAPGGAGRPRVEQQADLFAGCFLAPPKLVQAAFQARFPVRQPITNTGVICFNLASWSPHSLEALPQGSLEFARAVAAAESFGGNRFKSLAQLFSVSPTAMGIRLQQLGLVA